jgi:hypothetical protein
MAKRWVVSLFSIMALGFVLLAGSRVLFAATCTGADPCHACKNCNIASTARRMAASAVSASRKTFPVPRDGN